MPTVQISFLGVCTIFQDLPSLVPPGLDVPKSRVVLVKNTLWVQQLSGIDPHIAKIELRGVFSGPYPPPVVPPEQDVYSLDGVTLSIENAILSEGFAPSLGCLPGLQAHLNPAAELGPPARFVYEHDRALAAAWFDIPGGASWNSYYMLTDPTCGTVPSISILAVETTDVPILRITPWDGSKPTTVALHLIEGDVARVDVMNFAMGRGLVEDNRDFLLNYLAAATLPLSSVVIPQVNACTEPSPLTYKIHGGCGDAGPGCSNSNYP